MHPRLYSTRLPDYGDVVAGKLGFADDSEPIRDSLRYKQAIEGVFMYSWQLCHFANVMKSDRENWDAGKHNELVPPCDRIANKRARLIFLDH